jgi:hypothetical protein
MRSGEIDPDHRTGGFDLIAQPIESLARAASCIQYPHPGAEPQATDELPNLGLRKRIE